MKLVVIESPFRGNIERNVSYAFACCRDSIIRGESPYASHLIIPGALNDDDQDERNLGIRCGYAWWRAASLIAFYTDLGWSEGMLLAFGHAKARGLKTEERSIEDNSNGDTSARFLVKER